MGVSLKSHNHRVYDLASRGWLQRFRLCYCAAVVLPLPLYAEHCLRRSFQYRSVTSGATRSHAEPRGATRSHREPPRATGSRPEPPGATRSRAGATCHRHQPPSLLTLTTPPSSPPEPQHCQTKQAHIKIHILGGSLCLLVHVLVQKSPEKIPSHMSKTTKGSGGWGAGPWHEPFLGSFSAPHGGWCAAAFFSTISPIMNPSTT